jgi:hypothetical protein
MISQMRSRPIKKVQTIELIDRRSTLSLRAPDGARTAGDGSELAAEIGVHVGLT